MIRLFEWARDDNDGGDAGGGAGGGAGEGDAGTGDAGSTGWFDGLPADLKASPHLTNFVGKPVEELARSLHSSKDLISRSIRIPGDDASEEDRAAFVAKLQAVPGVARLPTATSTDEERAAFYAAIGRPDDPKGYEFAEPKDLPEGFEYQAGNELEQGFRELAHQQGLSKAQAAALHEWHTQQALGVAREQHERQQAAAQELRQEWGDRYEGNLGAVKQLLVQVGSEALVDELEKVGGLGNSPHLARTLFGIAKHMLEDGAIRSFARGGAGSETASTLTDEIAELRAHPAFFDAANPEHRSVVEKVNRKSEQLMQLRSRG